MINAFQRVPQFRKNDCIKYSFLYIFGVLCDYPCLQSVVSPSLNISETAHYFFLKLCMKFEVNKVKKVTWPVL